MSDDLFDVIDAGESEPDTAGKSAADTAGKSAADTAGEVAGGKAKVRLRVHVRPGAGRSAVVGRYSDALHLRVAAPPVDGRANHACVELLAEVLGVAEGDLALARGEKSADKSFEIVGVHVDALRRRLEELLEDRGTTAGGGRRRGGRR